MKRNVILTVAVGLCVVLAASWVVAQEAGERPRRRAGDREPGARRRAGPGGGGAVRGPNIPNLTDDQRKKIGEIRRAGMAEIRKIQEKMNEDIKKLLTPEQAKAFDAQRQRGARRGPGGVTLTDEQQKILDDARGRAREAGDRQAAMEIMREANEKVRASFTEEQKAQAAQGRRRSGERPERGERRGGGNRRGGRDRPAAEE